jgi:sugar phosphate isomerase/epimerase
MIAISTSWNFSRHGALVPCVAEIAKLGYEAVELSARGSVPDLHSVGEACRDGRMRVRSVHAPLTAAAWTDGNPAGALADPDEGRRRRAVATVLSCLPVAAAAGARVVVVHLGAVPIEGAVARQQAWLEALAAGEPLPDAAGEALAERERKRDAHLEAAARSLFDLTRAEPEVTFALETRLGFHAIPSFDEVELLLSDAAGKNVAYWHDTGHAALQGRVTGVDPLAWLDRYGTEAAGVHLHDVLGPLDHLPPGGGEVDWPAVAGYVSTGMVKVLEVNGRHSAAELAAGADFLAGVGIA